MTGTGDRPDLDTAYGLRTAEDAVRLYRDWAASYDRDFVAARDYRLPEVVALAFAGRGGIGPVLDIGAGTGAVAEHLARLGIGPIEGLDISAAMLAVAAGKNLYSALIEADLGRGLDLESGYYNGCVSAGTFTLGHVGPNVLSELIRVTAHGGLICLSVHAAHFEAAGFAEAFAALAPRIRDLRIDEARVYGEAATGAHRLDLARIVSFHRA
jgi:predicted TPR repeat methyltransferase